MPDDDATTIVIAEFARNDRETVRVMLDKFRGHDMVSIRNFYCGAGGEWKPGRGGVAMTVRHLPNLASAINDALAEARRAGLLAEQSGDDAT